MTEQRYRGRRARQIENESLRVTVLVEGGHIAEILHKPTGVNPLWTPPWPSIEPSTYSLAKHPEYGADSESKLLAGIMGHNLCVDLFGPPSDEEAAAGLTVHGEASVVEYDIEASGSQLVQKARLPWAGLAIERRIVLEGTAAHIVESVENLLPYDRPIAWTEHVTLGPPFLEKGATQFRIPVTKSNTPEGQPCIGDLELFTNAASSEGFTTHVMDESRINAWFLAWSPSEKLLFGYVWSRHEFPWLGIWEENYRRQTPPWNGQTLTRGLEFGVSPFAETRRQMIGRGSLLGVPAYRWLPGGTKATVRYAAFARAADAIPDEPPAL